MSGNRDEDGDKNFEPTQRKLDEARRKGELAKSADLNTAASYAGILVVIVIAGGSSLSGMASVLAWFLGQADTIAPLVFHGTASSAFQGVAREFVVFVIPWFLIPALLALASILAQQSFVVTPSRISPKLSRINPMSNAAQKFGRSGLFEFAKSFVKLLIFSAILWFFLRAKLEGLVQTLWMDPQMTILFLFELCFSFLVVVFLVAAVIGLIDLAWQKQDHLRKNRMSHKELRDESKESEGDPHMKQERRRRAYDLATNHMMQDVPTADVVIVNPTHFAVALKWSRKPGEAPVCVAKGQDEIALRIRELAREHGVAVHSDPPVARALCATTRIGDEIAPDHYRAVAAAIRFAENMRRKSRQGQI